MPQYETKYIFSLEVQGKDAVTQARAYRQQLQQALSGQQVGNLPALTIKPKVKLPPPEQILPTTWLDRFTSGVNEATKQLWGVRRAAYGIESAGRAVVRTSLAIAAASAMAAREYLSYDEALTRTAISMSLSSDMSERFRATILQSSIELGKFKPEELALGLRYWVEGTGEVIKTQEDLNRVMAETVAIQKLAALTDSNLATLTDQVGGIMAEFALDLKDVNMVTEVLNYTAATTFVHVNEMGNAFKMVGPLAHSMGITFTETASALALLSDFNIKGTMAGRAFRQMLLQMERPTDTYNETMNEMLGLSSGLGDAWKELVFPGGQFIGLANYFDLLAESVENLTEQEKNERLAALATANELPTLVALVNQQVDARKHGVNMLSVYQKVMNGVTDAEVMNYKAMYEAQTGLAFSLEGAMAMMTNRWQQYEKSDSFRAQQMQRRWEKAFIGLGEAITKSVLPYLDQAGRALDKFDKYITENRGLVELGLEMTATAFLIGIVTQQVGFLIKTLSNLAIVFGGLKAAGSIAGAFAPLVGAKGAALLARTPLGVPLWAVSQATTPPPGQGIRERVAAEPTNVQARWNQLFGPAPGQINAFVARTKEGEKVITQILGDNEKWISQGYDTERIITAIRDELNGVKSATDAATDSAGSYEREIAMVERRMRALPGVKGMLVTLGNLQQLTKEATVFEKGEADRLKITDRYGEQVSDLRLSRARADRQAEADYYFANQQAQLEFNEDALNRDRQYADERTRTIRDAGRAGAQAYEEYLRQQTRALEDFKFREQRTLADYAMEDARKQDEFNRNEMRAAAEHQTSLQRLASEHRNRMIDLAEAGDVRGMVKEMRDYKDRRKETEEDFRSQAGQSREDFQRQQGEEAERRALDARRRQEDFDRQQAEAKDNYQLQTAQRQEQLALQLADMKTAHEKEDAEQQEAYISAKIARWAEKWKQDAEREADYKERLTGLKTQLDKELEEWRLNRDNELLIAGGLRDAEYGIYTQRLKNLNEFVTAYQEGYRKIAEAMQSITPPAAAPGAAPEAGNLAPAGKAKLPEVPQSPQFAPAPWERKVDDFWQQVKPFFLELGSGLLFRGTEQLRQAGGYATAGHYTLGERGPEFVLSAPTTRLLETQWGRLSQPLFINKASRGEGASAFTYAPTFQGMGAEDKAWYAMVARCEAEKIINEKTGGYRR